MATESPRNSMSINSCQIEALTGFMERNPELARNLLKTPDAKAHSHRLWNTLKESLNALGPPGREVWEWKKVWADYKYKVRNKLRDNASSMKKTGGGPNKTKPLNVFEESVARSAGLHAAVSGIGKAKSFGSKKPAQKSSHEELESNENRDQTDPEVLFEEYLEEEFTSGQMSPEMEPGNQTGESGRGTSSGVPSTGNGSTKHRTNFKKERTELLRRYVEAQEESNEIQRGMLRVEEEKLEIKKKRYELALKKFKLLEGSNGSDEESDT